jgi:hypothetical protein
MDNLKRGDIVIYNNVAYYFQPWGAFCRLYTRMEYIGSFHKSSHCVNRYFVIKAPPESRVDPGPDPPFDEIDRLGEILSKMRKDRLFG